MPIIAAGGIVDGATMAAAFALGAEGVQMGTRMVSAAESPIHDNWKQAIVDAAETDTRVPQPAQRRRRCGRCAPSAPSALEFDTERNAMAAMADHRAVYFGGDMDQRASRSCGQVAGRIDAVRPVAEVIGECADDCLR